MQHVFYGRVSIPAARLSLESRDTPVFLLHCTDSNPNPLSEVLMRQPPKSSKHFFIVSWMPWLQEYYVDPVIFTHSEGHAFPTQPPRAREIYDRVAAEIWRQSGTRSQCPLNFEFRTNHTIKITQTYSQYIDIIDR